MDDSTHSLEVQAQIEKFRDLFRETYAENLKNDVYDERDTNKLFTDDKYVTKFLRPSYKATEITTLMHDSLKWRKDSQVQDLTADSIPDVLWDRNAVYFSEADKDGHKLLWVEVKKVKKDASLQVAAKNLFAFHMETFYRESPNDRLVILFDMSNSGLNNYELEFIRFIISTFKTYYPGILAYLLIYDAPWLFNAIWKIIKSWLRQDEIQFIKFAKKSNVQEYINKDSLFEHMGGLCVRDESSENSDTRAGKMSKKKVTFAEVECTEDSCSSNDSPTEDEPHANHLTLQIGKSKHVDSDDFLTVGDILNVSPSEDLEFTADDREELSAVISLSASGSNHVAFKIKTTSPEKFRVRPSIGVVHPSSPVLINVVLSPGMSGSINRDRFLVMVVNVPPDQKSISEMWKTVDKASILEHKLRCSLTYTPPSPTETPSPLYSDAKNPFPTDNSDIHKQLHVLSQSQIRLDRKLNVVLILVFVIMILLFYQYQYSSSCEHSKSVNQAICGDLYRDLL